MTNLLFVFEILLCIVDFSLMLLTAYGSLGSPESVGTKHMVFHIH